MEGSFCFDIAFPNVKFDIYFPNATEVEEIHHANLVLNDYETELRIYFDHKTNFSFKFSQWIRQINTNNFGSFVRIINLNKDVGLLNIDFSETKLIGLTFSSNQYEDNLGEYIVIKLTNIKMYFRANTECVNTAEFYMNDVGFDLVKYYYSMYGSNGTFNISRKNALDVFYNIEDVEFRPEFDYTTVEDINNSDIHIKKIPKIKFHFDEDVDEVKIIHYAEIIRLLGSFYMQSSIEFYFSRISLKSNTIEVYNAIDNRKQRSNPGFQGFGKNWSFHDFMKSNWQESALNNVDILSKAIQLFIQAMLVDHHSSLLIRYNVVEYCMGRFKQSNEKYKLILNEQETDQKYNKALELLLETIDINDRAAFNDKWTFQKEKLQTKPMKSLWSEFLKSQGFLISELPISVEKIKTIRDNITHGSLNKVNPQQLEKANILLYGITGVLILKLLNVNEFDLKRVFEKVMTIG